MFEEGRKINPSKRKGGPKVKILKIKGGKRRKKEEV